MLLANRRVALLQLLIAAMQAAWIAPFLALAWTSAGSPWGSYAIALIGLLAWMLALETLSRVLKSPLYDALALVLLGIVCLLLVRMVLYGGGRPWSLLWIGRALSDTVNWRGGLPPVVVILGANILLWQRAAATTSRDLSFFSVGVTFRAGFLLLLAGGALVTAAQGRAPLGLLWLYLGLGLCAVAVSRISEKASEAQSIGRMLPLQRLLQVLGAVIGAVGLSWVISLVYTPASIRAFIRLFNPLWQLVAPLFLALLLFLAQLLDPVFQWLVAAIARLLGPAGTARMEVSPLVTGAETGPGPLEQLPAWSLELVRHALLIVGAVVALIILVAFLLLYLEHVRKTGMQGETEDEAQDQATFGGGILDRMLDSLRGTASLIPRFGMSRELLAAISVQNIYANLCRIARQRGKPRLPSQPPDAYLPTLAQAFPGEEERLKRITAAYMRVHYGDHPVFADELAALREDYRVLREEL